MDGATLLGVLQGSDFSRIPVVVLTASTLNDLAADELGAPVLTKPFELDELLRMVSGLVNRTPASPPCVVASEA
jgi:DNA-binding response OmpR family regulator